MNEPIPISSPDELVAIIPHLLRFRPEDSIVCVGLERGLVARIDLPRNGHDRAEMVRSVGGTFRRQGEARVALVGFGSDDQSILEAMLALDTTMRDHAQIGPVLWVDGDEWFELDTSTAGTVSISAKNRMAAEFALRGRAQPASSRRELVASLRGDPTPVLAHLGAARTRFDGLDRQARMDEARWVADQLRTHAVARGPLRTKMPLVFWWP